MRRALARARGRESMAKKITSRKRSAEVEKWLRQEIREQLVRHKKIAKEQNETLAEQHEIWFREFELRIQTRGFNVHADVMRKIKREEIYPRPKRKTRVVY